jgi:hypothetical protein
VGLLAGCSNDVQLGRAPGEPVQCEGDERFPIRAERLTPALTYDYLAVRSRYLFRSNLDDDGAGSVPPNVTVLSEVGRRCAGATDETCESLVAQDEGPIGREHCGPDACNELSVLTTRDDEVRRWVTVNELKELVGEIDSVDDALLLVYALDYHVVCQDDHVKQTTVQEVDDGYLVYVTQEILRCSDPTLLRRIKLSVSRTGAIHSETVSEVTINEAVCPGRAPEGLRSASIRRGQSKLGDFLARCAHLEAASIFSFTRLARELEAHGAPAHLVARAREARSDEARHAAAVGALARAHGGELVPVVTDTLHVRPLEEMALENAVEGCVRETYAALIAAHQAERAEDPALRRAMRAIAQDEAGHASLSHAVHAWLDPQLAPESRERIRRAQWRALVELAQALRNPTDAELERAAGLPSPRVARRLLVELMAVLAELQSHGLA